MSFSRRTKAILAAIAVLNVAALLLTMVIVSADPLAARGAEPARVKVAIIVGPAGGVTDSYRALADKAAATASEFTDQIVKVYSPNATWPAVRRALRGASIVVYLGHGNGWPSPYRDELFPPTQNGLGLNPVAGVDDDAHQYFGERYLARSVHLARGAVVVMSHLCYASGNPEPGGPEPTLSVARQRADNYSAGWIAAGASAVIAEAHSGPAYYVGALLRGKGTVERIWRSAPTFHDHVLAFDSARTAGVSVFLDPDRSHQGYNRSLATVPGFRAADMLSSAPTPPASPEIEPTVPAGSLANRGIRFKTPQLTGQPVAGTRSTLRLPLGASSVAALPKDLSLGTRWDSVVPTTNTGPDASPVPAPAPEDVIIPDAVISRRPNPAATSPSPARSAAPSPSPIADPLTIDLIEPEVTGSLVTTAPTTRGKSGLAVAVTLPADPGVYRLVTTIHDGDGIAYDAETQALIPALIVQVTGTTWATYRAPDWLTVVQSDRFLVRARVANTGTQPWTTQTGVQIVDPNPLTVAAQPHVVARWLDLGTGSPDPAGGGPDGTIVPAAIAPGASAVLELTLRAPARPGVYLLVLDVTTSDGTSLASLGVPPAFIRVTVGNVLSTTSANAPADQPAGPGGQIAAPAAGDDPGTGNR